MSDLPHRDLDLKALKALAHPLRQRILYHLAFVGKATSTSVARAFGENTGATSYHLRQLAAAGLIQEVPGERGRRQRWWRIVPLDLGSQDQDASDAETRRLSDEWAWLQVERDHQLVRRYLSVHGNTEPIEEAVTLSSSATRLTPKELERFGQEYLALLKRYWRAPEESPPDAVPIAAVFYAFPWPGESS